MELERAAPNTIQELDEEKLGFASHIFENILGDLPEEDLLLPITFKGATSTVQDGIFRCIDHIIENDMTEEEIKTYAGALVALGRKQQGHA